MLSLSLYYIIIGAIVLHFLCTRFVWEQGTLHYVTNKNINIYDIIHNNTPDYSRFNYTKNWYLLLFLIPIVLNLNLITSGIVSEFVIKFCIVLIFRSIFMITTILPKQDGCSVTSLGLFDMTIGGTCYDKILSGHFAFGLLLTLMMFKYNFIKPNHYYYFVILNVIHAIVLAVTRSHYTLDIMLALCVTLIVNYGYDNIKHTIDI
jgi:hypothetical protein